MLFNVMGWYTPPFRGSNIHRRGRLNWDINIELAELGRWRYCSPVSMHVACGALCKRVNEEVQVALFCEPLSGESCWHFVEDRADGPICSMLGSQEPIPAAGPTDEFDAFVLLCMALNIPPPENKPEEWSELIAMESWDRQLNFFSREWSAAPLADGMFFPCFVAFLVDNGKLEKFDCGEFRVLEAVHNVTFQLMAHRKHVERSWGKQTEQGFAHLEAARAVTALYTTRQCRVSRLMRHFSCFLVASIARDLTFWQWSDTLQFVLHNTDVAAIAAALSVSADPPEKGQFWFLASVRLKHTAYIVTFVEWLQSGSHLDTTTSPPSLQRLCCKFIWRHQRCFQADAAGYGRLSPELRRAVDAFGEVQVPGSKWVGQGLQLRLYRFGGRFLELHQSRGLNVGGLIWHSAPLMCEYLHQQDEALPGCWDGQKAVELGAGPGLVGIAGALLGMDVTLTDMESQASSTSRGETILDLATRNGQLNLLKARSTNNGNVNVGSVRVHQLGWGSAEDLAAMQAAEEAEGRAARPYDLVLGSDILYNEGSVPALLDTLLALCGEDTRVLLAFQKHLCTEFNTFFQQAPARGFTVVQLPLPAHTPQIDAGVEYGLCCLSRTRRTQALQPQ